MDPHPADDTDHLELQRGEQWTKHLTAGTRIIVIDGAARLEGPPCWLGDSLHAPRQRLAAGDDWVASVSGWVRLSAERPCVLVCIAPSGTSLGRWLKAQLEKGREGLRKQLRRGRPGWPWFSAAAAERPPARGC